MIGSKEVMDESKKNPNIYVDNDSVIIYDNEKIVAVNILVDTIKKINMLENLDVITYCKIVQEISKLIIDII